LLQFSRYQVENIPADFCTEPSIFIHPYFDNVVPPSAYGAEIGWTPDSPPRAIPMIDSPEDMERFPIPEPDAGLRGKTIEWWLEMKELASQTRLTFNGIEGQVKMAPLGSNYLSPHMIAIDLVGTDFYVWMMEYPDACHQFLGKITRAEIEAEELVRKLDPRPRGDFYGLAEDSATILSPQTFKAFCIPYTGTMFNHFGAGLRFGRGIHMCGDSTHLLKMLKDNLGMTHFDIFGYMVSPLTAANQLGGNTLLWGNVNPMLMKDGSPEEVKEATLSCLQAMAPVGGFMLGDGANVCPGTPLESFHIIQQAAEEYGCPEGLTWKS
jgi:uroporphyrinogen-III decarboxylase